MYFECSVAANPPLSHIQWTLDDRELPHDKDIIVQVSPLVAYLRYRDLFSTSAQSHVLVGETNKGGKVSNRMRPRQWIPRLKLTRCQVVVAPTQDDITVETVAVASSTTGHRI